MRRTFVILGTILGILVAGGVFLFIQFSRPTTADVPVAIDDIPAGTVLRANLFRMSSMANVDGATLARWVRLTDWPQADGKTTTSDIRAGFPVARAQIDPNSSAAPEARLSTMLTGTRDAYVVIPVKPDEVGNYVQPGDRIDLIVNIGNAERKDTLAQQPIAGSATAEAPSPSVGVPILGPVATAIVTQTASPVSKLVMQNLEVLRVERERPVQRAAAPAGTAADAVPTGPLDVKRLYVRVTRDQLEVISFVLNNGKRTIAVRAASGDQAVNRTDGVVWDDFVRWLFEQRGGLPNVAQPFRPATPSR